VGKGRNGGVSQYRRNGTKGPTEGVQGADQRVYFEAWKNGRREEELEGGEQTLHRGEQILLESTPVHTARGKSGRRGGETQKEGARLGGARKTTGGWARLGGGGGGGFRVSLTSSKRWWQTVQCRNTDWEMKTVGGIKRGNAENVAGTQCPTGPGWELRRGERGAEEAPARGGGNAKRERGTRSQRRERISLSGLSKTSRLLRCKTRGMGWRNGLIRHKGKSQGIKKRRLKERRGV